MDYHYELPKELIAQEPMTPRSSSRLMVLSPGEMLHRCFSDLPRYLRRRDVLVLNNTKVLPVRLEGRKITGGKIEVTLIKEVAPRRWRCFVRGRVGRSAKVFFNSAEAQISREGGERSFVIRFTECDPLVIIKEHGEAPLPPYVKHKVPLENYQTVYAEISGSIASPTAGLHFTPELLRDIEKKGVEIAKVTLHIGPGTFLPVNVRNIEGHRMEPEFYMIDEENAERINAAERVIAVGTTTVKALESASKNGMVLPQSGWSRLFIYPPYKFKSRIHGLLTNFHLPGSSLLMLVSAYSGWDRIMEAYKRAIKERYRFYSFGDAMLILKCSL
jgi:S-adenosylmethionine:tRNA ribosyltransferase-isomerase